MCFKNGKSNKKRLLIILIISIISVIAITVSLTVTLLIINNKKTEYNITYVLNSEYAINSEDNKSKLSKDEKLILKEPSRNGYIFGYWRGDDGIAYSAIENLEKDLTLYAIWSDAIFKVENGKIDLTNYGQTQKEIIIPDKVEGVTINAIAPNGFSNNLIIESLTITTFIVEIGENAFKNTPNLKTIRYLGTESEWNLVLKDNAYLYDKLVICSNTNMDEEFTITWVDFDDKVLSTETNQKYGTLPVYKNEAPTRESTEEFSYNFLGWNPEITYITKDVTYKAKYEEIKNKYKVSFDSNGGSIIYSQYVNYGEKAEVPSKPTKENYEFDGWYIDDSFKNLFDFDTEIIKDITLYAAWKLVERPINKYIVSFNSNGGTRVESQLIDEGSKAAYPIIPSKDGFTFLYWYLHDENVEFNFETLIYEDLTLYAKWKKDSTDLEVISISFETNGGSLIPSFEILKGTKVNRPEDPTKDGYIFENWYKDSELTLVFDFNTILTEHLVLYAKWTEKVTPKPKNVVVSFDLNGGEGEISPISVLYGTKIDEPNPPHQDGYFFKCWMLGEEKFDFDNLIYEDITLVAKWVGISDINYSISFYDEDGITLLCYIELLSGLIPVYSGEDPYKPSDSVYNYEFIGWDHEIEMVESDQVYIAVYEKTYVEYLVKFVDYDGKIISSKTYHYEDVIEIPDDPVRESTDGKKYKFNGWSPVISVVLGDATYYATYLEVTD